MNDAAEVEAAPSVETVADVLAAALGRHEVTHVFGQSIPAAFFVVAHKFGIRQVSYRTENAGGAMADGYARISGKVGVVAAQNGPAATLLVAPLAEALKASVPLVAIVQDVPTSMVDRNAFQELDHVALFGPVAKWVRRVTDATRIDDYVDAAFTAATSGRPGPAVLILPMDLLRKPAASSNRTASLGRFPLDRYQPSSDAVGEVAKMIAASRRPYVLAGGGVHLSGASEALAQLSELAAIPVATTNMGKGVMDETSPLSLGVFGNCTGAGTMPRHLGTMLADADLVILAGTRTNQNGTDSWKAIPTSAKLVHIDIDPQEIGRTYETTRLMGDVKLTLEALTDELKKLELPFAGKRHLTLSSEIQHARAEVAKERAQISAGRPGAIRPEAIMFELDKLIRPDDIVVADASYSTNWANTFLTARKNGARFLTPRGLAGLGWGFPMAIGAKAAVPGARVFALEGDGGFGHCWSELESARRMGLPVILIVLNNSILGYEFHAENVHYGMHTDACSFGSVDHAAIARATGCFGERVEDPKDIAAALERAIAFNGPAVLDIITDSNAFPPLSLFSGDSNPAARDFPEVGLS
ncbi:acetolactate synthase catalytic subunit [Paraburkholderia sp. BL25I1N1]|uniref:acetolactate synthase catalytic subunit n=1 Tax=Paraburkholderia sp. BL25I1N1 TaxID=1938804 RepID=UPI000D04AF5A|nr:acetolactate synthase catalytic subunit [Paraburkholderia sp. BL25I1N1]